ncbi:uncharacterized protein ACNS7B_021123 [Menidia menidia]
MYAQGIVALFPYLDPYLKQGYEDFYDPERGSGYLAWRLKSIHSKTAEERGGGPSRGQPRPFTADQLLADEEEEAAVAVLRPSADEDSEDLLSQKMEATFIYPHIMVNHESSRCLLSPPTVSPYTRTANRLLEKWPTGFKAKVITESQGLVASTELLDLMRNAESAAWFEDVKCPPSCCSSISCHHLPRGKMSAGWNQCRAASGQHQPKQVASAPGSGPTEAASTPSSLATPCLLTSRRPGVNDTALSAGPRCFIC